MTAVESHGGAPGAFLDTPSEPPTSRFTAVNVNGREPLPSAPIGNGAMRRQSEDRPETQSRVTPPGQEKLTITTTSTHREDWSRPNGGEKSSAGSVQIPPPPTFHEGESSHKRKRSGSDGGESREPTSSGSYHKHSLPALKPGPGAARNSPDTPYSDAGRDSDKRDVPQSASRDPYATPQTPYPHYGDSSARENGGSASWYSQQPDRTPIDAAHSAISQMSQMSPDEQLREALQRENQSDGQGGYGGTSPGDEDGRGSSYPGSYGQDRASVVRGEGEQKKRKRNFSNRTKTGCMTCRKRKKKCDESRPECNNCIRGGFVCNGYPSRGQWQKSEQKQVPVPLQSKDGYDTSPNQYQAPPYPQQPPPQQQQSQAKREPLPSYPSRQPLRVDPHQPSARNLGTDDERQSASTLPSASAGSPEKRLSAITYSQATTFPTPVSASPSNYPDRMNQMDFQRMPPLLDPTRNDHDTGTPQSAHSAVPHISILHPSLTNSPHPHTPQSTAAQDAARLALSHPAAASRPRTQKEEMLASRNFFPFDRELVLERERCSAACWRFNNSTNPNNGNLPEDRPRLFRDILQPKEMINMEGQTTSPVSPAGYVGHDVVVTAPFNCDYGYNIQIGQEVNIGKNCTILDAAEVRIGDKTVIGPNVTLCTTTVPIHPAKRNGSKGPQMGKPIIIEQDCLIGAGAIILPGRTVKRGSTVGAGSVVTRDVPPFTVVAGNPARVVRGIHE